MSLNIVKLKTYDNLMMANKLCYVGLGYPGFEVHENFSQLVGLDSSRPILENRVIKR